MERLDSIKVSNLTEDCFKEYPIWVWDDEEEKHCPVRLEGDILPGDLGTLFIKAVITTTSGRTFHGYVVGLSSFYCFSILINGKKFIFNMNMTDFIDHELKKLYDFLKQGAFDFFPVTYRTDFQFPDGQKVIGIFES